MVVEQKQIMLARFSLCSGEGSEASLVVPSTVRMFLRSRREYLFLTCLPCKGAIPASVADTSTLRHPVDWATDKVAWLIPIAPENIAAASDLTLASHRVPWCKRRGEAGEPHDNGCQWGSTVTKCHPRNEPGLGHLQNATWSVATQTYSQGPNNKDQYYT